MCKNLIGVVSCVLMVLAGVVAEAQVEQIDHLVVVLDSSGSMNETMGSGGSEIQKMEAAKQALKQVLFTLPETTRVGVLVFPEPGWIFDLAPLDRTSLEAAIDRVYPNGGTPLGASIKNGADRLLESRSDQLGLGSYRLLVITDGEAGDQDLVDRFTPDVMSRGIRVDVIGVDMKTDHTLATRIHTYRRADDPSELTRAIREVVAEVSSADLSDTAGEDAFELVAGLPDGLASEIISALASSGNHPIGDSPQTGDSEDQPAGDLRPSSKRKKSGTCMGVAAIGIVFVFLKLVRRRQ